MKKMLVILALAMFSFANAQKGSVLVMGSINYSSQTTSSFGGDAEQKVFTFSPKVGYQFHKNWTAGIEASVGTIKQEYMNYDEEKTNASSFGGFIRYSQPLNQTFSFYTDLGLGFQNLKNTYYDYNDGISKQKADGIYIGVTPAIFINVNKGFGLNFNIGGIGYDTLSYNHGGGDVKTFNFTFGQAFSVGISKNF
jgi:hypothetical protein